MSSKLFTLLILSTVFYYGCHGHQMFLDIFVKSDRMDGKADIVFLLDRSGSVGHTNFEIQKGFVESLLMHVAVDPNATRVAIISYSTTPKLHIDYIRHPKSKCFLTHEMQDIQYDDSSATDIAAALEEAWSLFDHSRPNVNKVVILISDGMNTHGKNPIPVAKLLKDGGVEIFTFGVGKFLMTQLRSMASSPDHMHVCTGFKEFKRLARKIRGDPHEVKWSKDSTLIPNCNHLCDNPYQDEPGDPGCCDHHAECSCALLSGMHTCVCKPGYFGLSGTWGKCTACPRGTYKSQLEPRQSCLSCPRYATTAETTSTSLADCYCKDGYTGNPNKGLPCIAIKCPPLQNPTNGLILGTCNNDFGSTCHFMCYQGYTFEDDNNDILTCQSDEKWSHDLPICRPLQCIQPVVPSYGNVKCSGPPPFGIGSTCSFSCLGGFVLKGSKIRECLPSGKWSGFETRCESLKCPIPKRLPHGTIVNCNALTNPVFHQTCIFRCNHGFHLTGPQMVYCNEHGQLIDSHSQIPYAQKTPKCEDREKPEISCPPSKQYECDPGQPYATVTWEDPEAFDNSGEIPMIKPKSHHFKSPMMLLIGMHVIGYEATDRAGLKSSCEFRVSVLDREAPIVLSCPSVVKMDTVDYQRIVIWEEPVFKDNSQQPLDISKTSKSGDVFRIGEHYVRYLATDSSGNWAACEFQVIVTQNECPYYPAPANGAFVCEDWMYGQYCQAYCDDRFDFVTQPADWYICDHEAKWTTDPIGHSIPWPDCYRKASPNGIRQKLSGYYYSGNCNDPVVQEAIKRSFLRHFLLKFGDCSDSGACTLEMIRVKCGTMAYPYARLKRSLPEIEKIKIDVYISIDRKQMGNESDYLINSLVESLSEFDWNDVDATMEKNISSFENDVNAENILDNKTSLVIVSSEVKPTCLPGSIVLDHKCMLCPPGTYHNVKDDRCSDCPLGFYQEQEGQMNCSSCPLNETTRFTHSKNITDCKRICPKGTYSPDGLETCLACPLDTYQDKVGQTICLSCPNATTTAREASTSSQDCRELCVPGSFSESGYEPCLLCPIGFYQPDPGHKSCMECPSSLTTIIMGSDSSMLCIDYDRCGNEMLTCQNGGSCVQSQHSVICECLSGYEGSYCEKDIDECLSNPCSDNGHCLNVNGSFHCICHDGFEGSLCDNEIDECRNRHCLNNGTCVHQNSSFLCLCPPTHSGINCEVKLDLCSNDIICLNDGYCDDTSGLCICVNGFEGSDCSINTDDCHNVTCFNGGSCVDEIDNFHCDCSMGYEGTLCENEIDECFDHSCFGSSKCIDRVGYYECLCSPGWTGVLCAEKGDSDFVLSFPDEASIENFASLNLDSALPALTISLWVQTHPEWFGTPVSYATYDSSNRSRIIDNALTMSTSQDCVVYINNEPTNIDNCLTDNNWHHLAVTWTSEDSGFFYFYIDGKLFYNREYLQSGQPISSGGQLIIGQEQDIVGSGFSLLESFHGNISRLNIWDKSFTSDDVLRLASLDDDIPNKVVAWSDYRADIYGDVKLLDNQRPIGGTTRLLDVNE